MGCLPLICIPSRDRHQSLSESLLAAMATGARVLVCDQSSQPYPAGAGYEVLHRPDLESLPAARNALLQAAGSEPLIIFIDDDTTLAPDFAIQIARLAREEPDCSAWGPVMEQRSVFQQRLHRLAQLGYARDPRRLCSGPSDRWTRALFGCCFALRRQAAVAIGGFDNGRRGYCLGEDLDFFLRLHQAGYRQRFASCLQAQHRCESSGRAGRIQRGAAKARFWLWLARRHGRGNPATLLHLGLSLATAATPLGQEAGSLRGVLLGLCQPQADRVLSRTTQDAVRALCPLQRA